MPWHRARNNSRTTLDGVLAVGATSCPVVNAAALHGASPVYPYYATIWNYGSYRDPTDDAGAEVVDVTAAVGNTLTIVRAREGTADAEHASGLRIARLNNESYTQELQDAVDLKAATGHDHAGVYAPVAQTMYLGTTGVAINRGSGALALAGVSIDGLAVTAGKTLSVNNSLTLAATDGSTLTIGAGGTLASAAYTPVTDYAQSALFENHQHALSGATAVWTSQGDWEEGTRVNADTTTTPGSFGITSTPMGGLAFTGVGGSRMYVAANAALKVSYPITIEMWVDIKANAQNAGLHYKGAGGNTQADYGFSIYAASGPNVIEFYINKVKDVSTSTVSTGLHHIECSYDGGYKRIFIDGVKCGEFAKTGAIDLSDTETWLGEYYNNTQWTANATIYVTRISNVCRHTNNFTPTKTITADGNTIALWQMTEGTGTTVADTSGSGATGTLTGTYSWASQPVYPSYATDIVDFDAGISSSFPSIAWSATTPGSTLVKCRFSSAATQAALTDPTGAYTTTAGAITVTANRWIRCEFRCETSLDTVAPSWQDATLTYTAASGQGLTVDHANLSNKGTTTHAALDTHVAAALTASGHTVSQYCIIGRATGAAGGAVQELAYTGTVGTAVVLATSPVLVTPTLGVAAATSLSFGNQLSTRDGLLVNVNGNLKYGIGFAYSAGVYAQLRSYVSSAAGTTGGHVWGKVDSGDGTTFTEQMRLVVGTGNLLVGTTTDGLTTGGSINVAQDIKAGVRFGLGLTPIARRAHVADATDLATALTSLNAALATLEAYGFHATS